MKCRFHSAPSASGSLVRTAKALFRFTVRRRSLSGAPCYRSRRSATHVWRLSFLGHLVETSQPEGLRRNASVRLDGLEAFCSAGVRRVTFNAPAQAPLASTAALATGTAQRAPALIRFAVVFDWQIGQSAPVLRTTASEQPNWGLHASPLDLSKTKVKNWYLVCGTDVTFLVAESGREPGTEARFADFLRSIL